MAGVHSTGGRYVSWGNLLRAIEAFTWRIRVLENHCAGTSYKVCGLCIEYDEKKMFGCSLKNNQTFSYRQCILVISYFIIILLLKMFSVDLHTMHIHFLHPWHILTTFRWWQPYIFTKHKEKIVGVVRRSIKCITLTLHERFGVSNHQQF